MTRKLLYGWTVVVIFTLVLVLSKSCRRHSPPSPSPGTLPSSIKSSNPLQKNPVNVEHLPPREATNSIVATATTTRTSAPSSGVTSPLEMAPPLPPLTVLDNCRVIIHNYAARFGENPVGNNAEITAALMGNNPKQVNFLREDSGLKLNDKGELLDGYGTPFFFHQLSSQVMEIRSAGEDKKLWTLDDQVTR